MVYHSKHIVCKSGRFRARLASIKFALSGIRHLVRQEPNARIHLIATVAVIAAGIIRHIDAGKWLAVIIVIVLVWLAEAFNTAIEMLCDLWCNGQFHPKVKIIKDISAGAVLIASIGSIATAFLVFFFL